MIKIRRGCFETNSSSMHSLCINKSYVRMPTPEENAAECRCIVDGVLDLSLAETNDFGWGWEVLSRCEEKLTYAFAEFRFDEKMIQKLINMACKNISGVNSVEFPHTWWEKDGKDYGNVDHQSQGMLSGAVDYDKCKSECNFDLLEEIIFSKRHVIVLADDNNDYEYNYEELEKSCGYVIWVEA